MDVREKLVKLIVWIEDQMTRAYPYTTDQFRIETTVDHLIANGVTVQEWIPVTERLPEINDKARDWSVTVLFRTIQGYVYSGYRNVGSIPQSYYDDDFTAPYWLDESENLDFDENEVTHWMPLPQPPKEGTT